GRHRVFRLVRLARSHAEGTGWTSDPSRHRHLPHPVWRLLARVEAPGTSGYQPRRPAARLGGSGAATFGPSDPCSRGPFGPLHGADGDGVPDRHGRRLRLHAGRGSAL
ncbi:MAG: hypothetical protein AVDCRST_MAG93-180, partial [uncultured Chloroflexia bacterium]